MLCVNHFGLREGCGGTIRVFVHVDDPPSTALRKCAKVFSSLVGPRALECLGLMFVDLPVAFLNS